MNYDDWKSKAIELYFDRKFNIQEISHTLGVSRKSVSKHLRLQPEYAPENEKRKATVKENRKEYKRNWDRKNRPGRYSTVTGDTMRREHDVAVIILSHEKY